MEVVLKIFRGLTPGRWNESHGYPRCALNRSKALIKLIILPTFLIKIIESYYQR